MAGEVALTFKFTGGDADQNQLNFYDAGRFYYAAARLVYTLEQFRQTGRVINKITERVNVDYRVATSRQGSWVVDVLAVAGPAVADLVIKVPLDVLVAYIVEKLLPAKEAHDLAIQLERERTLQEQERTKQSEQETRRLELATQSQDYALKILVAAFQDSERRKAVGEDKLLQAMKDLEQSIGRQQLLAQHKDELEKITEDQISKLLARAQGQVAEIGHPLIRSASDLSIVGRGERPAAANLNRRSVEALQGNKVDKEAVVMTGNVTRYDKENGWGKIKVGSKHISFVVPASRRTALRDEVLDAMKNDEVNMIVFPVRNSQKTIKYLVFDDIFLDEDAA